MQATLWEEAPSRNLKLNKGTSVSLFSSIEDCVSGSGSLQVCDIVGNFVTILFMRLDHLIHFSPQERMSREDNCYNGIQFRCYHEDRFSEYTYEMIKWPNADCTEVSTSRVVSFSSGTLMSCYLSYFIQVKAKGSDISRVVKTKFTRAEGCQEVMPLDATYGHPMIHCGQHW